MDKTLLRHRTRRHSLYREGASQITLAYSEDLKKQRHLLGQWLKFCIWSISQDDVRLDTLESVTREHIIRYGRYLKGEFLNGNYASTAAPLGYLSALNTVMKAIRGDAWQTVSPRQDCGLAAESCIPKRKPALGQDGLPDLAELAGYLLALQAALGVDLREALSLDLKQALTEGRRTGFVTVANWRSGMRRKVPCRPIAVQALGQAIAARRLQKRLPKPMAYDDFVAAHKKLAARTGYSTNTARGVYVRERYQELTGLPAPVVSGFAQAAHLQALADHAGKTLSEAKSWDKHTRHRIAKEIGVLGIEPLNAYLDPRAQTHTPLAEQETL
jgi:integrase